MKDEYALKPVYKGIIRLGENTSTWSPFKRNSGTFKPAPR